MKYDLAKDADWIKPVQNNYKLMCCDCGLVHIVDFRINDNMVELRFSRDNRATGQARRHRE